MRNKTDEVWNEAEDSGEETDEEDCAESEWDELDDQDFAERLAEMAITDDPNDLDWFSSRLCGKKGKKISYMRSPGCWGCRSLSLRPEIRPFVPIILFKKIGVATCRHVQFQICHHIFCQKVSSS